MVVFTEPECFRADPSMSPYKGVRKPEGAYHGPQGAQ